MPTASAQQKTQKTPRIRFGGFSGNWEEKKLGEITKINQGLQIPISERYFEKVPNSHFYITNEFLKKDSQKEYYIKNPPKSVLCNDDDILMTRTGNTGHVVTNVSGAFHNNFFKIKFNKSEITKSFLYYFLVLPKTKNFILRLAGTSTIPDLNHGDFYKVRINFPSLPEQQKIAGFLGAVDRWVENLRAQKASLESYKKGMMQKIFSQEIRFKLENGKAFPAWEEKKLGEIADIYQPKTISQSDLLKTGKFEVWGANGIIGKYDKYNHEQEQVIITCRGSTCGTINYTPRFSWITGNAMVINVDDNVSISKVFLFYYLQDDNLQYLVSGSGQPQITGNIKKHKIKLPSLPEQQKIADFLTSLDKVIESKQHQITEAEQWKKGLMQGLFV